MIRFPVCEPSHSFKLPLRDSFPVSHVHSQPCPRSISHSRSLYTVYRVTDNRLNSNSQFIDPLRSTVQSFYNPMIHRIMIHHLKIQPFQKTNRSHTQTVPTPKPFPHPNRSHTQTVPTVKSPKQQPGYQSGFPDNKPCPQTTVRYVDSQSTNISPLK